MSAFCFWTITHVRGRTISVQTKTIPKNLYARKHKAETWNGAVLAEVSHLTIRLKKKNKNICYSSASKLFSVVELCCFRCTWSLIIFNTVSLLQVHQAPSLPVVNTDGPLHWPIIKNKINNKHVAHDNNNNNGQTKTSNGSWKLFFFFFYLWYVSPFVVAVASSLYVSKTGNKISFSIPIFTWYLMSCLFSPLPFWDFLKINLKPPSWAGQVRFTRESQFVEDVCQFKILTEWMIWAVNPSRCVRRAVWWWWHWFLSTRSRCW